MSESNLKKNENSTWERDFNDLFKEYGQSEVEMFIHLAEMVMHNQLEDNNLSHLYKAVGLEGFLDVVAILQGRTIKIPSLEDVREYYTLAVVYYYKEILGWSWKKIKASDVVNLDASLLNKENSISYGIRINQLGEAMRRTLNEELIKFSEKHRGEE